MRGMPGASPTGVTKFVKNPDSGVRVVRAGEERIDFTDERLRIVSQDLWDRVKARQAQRRKVGALVRGGLRKRSGGGGRPGKYLLTGLLVCGVCNGSFVLRNRAYYACGSHWNGGGCSNTLNVPRSLVEKVLIDGLKEDLSDPVVIKEIERQARAMVRQPVADHGKRIAELRREIGNLADAIASGLLKSSPALAQRLQAAEAELSRLEAPQRSAPTAMLMPNVREHYLGMIERLAGVLQMEPERGREELRGILGDRIKLQPHASGRYLLADYSLGIAALLPSAEIMVAGAGFEPATFGL